MMAALILISSLALIAAQVAPAEPLLGTSVALPPERASVSSAVLTRDTRGRPTLDAEFNGRGPFRMVLDTAAQTSLIAASLARELALPELGETLAVGGVSGRQSADLYAVERYKTALFDAHGLAIPALPNTDVTEARGIIGMEMFADHRLVFDHAAERIRVEPSGAATEGFVAVSGRLDQSGLLTVPVEIDGVRFTALIDTGASVSVASGGALRALGWKETDPRLAPAGAIRGATSHSVEVLRGRVGLIRLGPVNLRDAPLIFMAGEPAETDGPGDPFLILGADLLYPLEAYALDFPRAELHIRVPR